MPIGVSSGSEGLIEFNGDFYCTVGTLGVRVTDGYNVFALSNAHVYAREGSNSVGNVNAGQNGDWILQPGRVDLTGQACGTSTEIQDARIGHLADFKPIDFSANNVIDAAIASTTASVVGNSTPPDGYGTPKSETAPAELNQRVQKYGRTTGLTKNGRITGINATVTIGYDTGNAVFEHQIIVQPGNFIRGGVPDWSCPSGTNG